MRLAGSILVVLLLVALILFVRSGSDHITPVVLPDSYNAATSSAERVDLAPVEAIPLRTPVPDPVVDVDPADYSVEILSSVEPSTELAPELRGIEIAGSLIVSPEWEGVKPQVILCRVGGGFRDILLAQDVRSAPGTIEEPNTSRWRALVQGAGRYWVGTRDPASLMEIEVSGDMTDLRIVLSHPVQMEAVVVDARTQLPVTEALLSYEPRGLGVGGRTERVRPDPSTPGVYRWRCAPGDGVITCRGLSKGYEDLSVNCTAGASSNSVRLELIAATCIRVRATFRDEATKSDDTTLAKAYMGLVVEKAGVPSPLEGVLRSVSKREAMYFPPRSGTYVVRVAHPPAGFRAPPPQTVFVGEHECVDIAFEFEPE